MRHFLLAAIAGSLLTVTGLTSTGEASRWNRGWRHHNHYHYRYRPYRGNYSYFPYYNRYRYWPNYGYGYRNNWYGGGVNTPWFSVWW